MKYRIFTEKEEKYLTSLMITLTDNLIEGSNTRRFIIQMNAKDKLEFMSEYYKYLKFLQNTTVGIDSLASFIAHSFIMKVEYDVELIHAIERMFFIGQRDRRKNRSNRTTVDEFLLANKFSLKKQIIIRFLDTIEL